MDLLTDSIAFSRFIRVPASAVQVRSDEDGHCSIETDFLRTEYRWISAIKTRYPLKITENDFTSPFSYLMTFESSQRQT